MTNTCRVRVTHNYKFLIKLDADKSKHTHWKNIEEIVRKSTEIVFVLIHFSLRYSDQQVLDFFENMKEKKPANIVVFVPDAK